VFTKDGIHTLIDVVIAKPTRADLLLRFYTTQRFATSDVAQAKKKSFHNRHPTNQFFPFAIEVFGCLCKHGDVFLHDCAIAIWSLKGPKNLHLLPWSPFFCQIFFITLQRMQMSSILN
jgi:hypothetical protein